MDHAVLLARPRDVHADLRVVAADRFEDVELRLDVDAHRRRGLVERRLHERLRGEMEDAVGPDRANELLHGAGVGELAVEEAYAVFARLVALARPRGVATLDDVEDAL